MRAANLLSKPTVVLLHGYMDAGGTWDLVAPHLRAAGYEVITPDLRGYGKGPRAGANDGYHFADYVLDLARMLEAVPQRPLYLVGHSMGGVVATLFAGTYPERVDKLAVLEGLGPPDHVPGTMTARLRAFVEGTLRAERETPRSMTLDEALARMKVQHARIDESVLRSRLPHLLEPAEGNLFRWLYDLRHRAKSASPFMVSNFAEYAGAITCPVLFVSGGNTGYHPDDEAARLTHYKNLTTCTLQDAGHMMHWTQPEPLSRALLDFLAQPV
jgi:pimeloyl-ACP methyl ester carboxylesterase